METSKSTPGKTSKINSWTTFYEELGSNVQASLQEMETCGRFRTDMELRPAVAAERQSSI